MKLNVPTYLLGLSTLYNLPLKLQVLIFDNLSPIGHTWY